MPPKKGKQRKTTTKGVGKARQASVPDDVEMVDTGNGVKSDSEMSSQPPGTNTYGAEADTLAVPTNEESAASGTDDGTSGPKKAMTPQERVAKLAQLREKMVCFLAHITLRRYPLLLWLIIIYLARVCHR